MNSASPVVVLVTASGRDQTGLMARLTGLLEEHEAQVLDVGQAVIHQELALGLLVQLAPDTIAAAGPDRAIERLQGALQALAEPFDGRFEARRIAERDYENWVADSGQPRWVITLLMGAASTPVLGAVSAVCRLHGLNIDTIRRLSARTGLATELAERHCCVEMRVRGVAGDLAALRADLLTQAARLGFDFSVQEDTVFRRNRRLVAFDMDSTLIGVEVIDELARRQGQGSAVQALTRRAMVGELDFRESFRARVALLRGLPASVLAEMAQTAPLNPGARRLIQALRHFGYRTAILSGGFQDVGDHLQARLGIDHVHANRLQVQDGVITGRVLGDIIDADAKAGLLRRIAATEGIALAQTIAIGDGANDLPMLAVAGLGVAYHAKPVVRASARNAISNFGLDAVLYLIGFSDRDIEQAFA